MVFYLAELRVAPVERRTQTLLLTDAPEGFLFLGGRSVEDAPQVGGVRQRGAHAHDLDTTVERLLRQAHPDRRNLRDEQRMVAGAAIQVLELANLVDHAKLIGALGVDQLAGQ